MDSFVKLQAALDKRRVVLSACDLYADLRMLMDQPNGTPRFTYVNVNNGKVQAISLFVAVDPIQGVTCFQTGYAIIQPMRQKGLASDIVRKGIQELRNGFARIGAKRFYVEAVVGVTNTASNKLAKRPLSDTPKAIIDAFSGEPALQYMKLIECGT